ncbi:hypothetical protein EDB83DRAFT_818077 [Lactarius deliciosus]|nr:hypothetical protein EDB83DRAFT_818077 [Lactarius deliciosus]
MVQRARHRPKPRAVCHPTPVITRHCNTQYVRTRGIRDAFGFVAVACVSYAFFFPATESKNTRVATFSFYRLLKNTPVGHLRRRHTDESHRMNHHFHYSLPLRILPPQDLPLLISPVSVPSRRTPASPFSNIHLRSLPIPPTPSSTKLPIPPLPTMLSHSSPASPDRRPGSSTSPHPPLPRPRFYTRLRRVSSFPDKTTIHPSNCHQLLRHYPRSISFGSGLGPVLTRRCGSISEHPDHEYLAWVWCVERQEREPQSRPVDVGPDFW